MDFGRAFTFAFDDKEWVTKLLIGGILSLIPIVNLVVVGYTLKTLKNVADGVEPPLPGWDDFADYFVKGLISCLGVAVWAIPILAVTGMFGVFGLVAGYDPGYGYEGAVNLCFLGLNCLSFVYGLLLGVILPAALTGYAITDEFGSFFRFGEIFGFIKSNLGNYAMAILLALMAQFVAGFGVILCFIGVVFTEFWAGLVGAHLFGQVYQDSTVAEPEAAA